MLEFVSGLFDTAGFRPLGEGGAWTPALTWAHVGGDLFIGLALVSIQLVLLYLTRRRDFPYRRLVGLAGLFLLACGVGCLIDAVTFRYPVYRLAGAWKAATAVLSWAAAVALVAAAPHVLREAGASGDSGPHRPAAPRSELNDYIIAILAGVLALLLRAAVDPVVEGDHVYVLALLAVVFVSWQGGFWPGIVTLLISMVGMVYFFVPPRHSFVVEGLGNQFSTALFFFCGVCCAGLGEAQRAARRGAKAALAVALERKADLEAEVARRVVVESALRQREAELTELNQKLAAAQVRVAEALAQLDAFLDNAPVGIAFYDAAGRYLRVNPHLAEANGRPAADHVGRHPREVLPGFPEELAAAVAGATRPGAEPAVRTVTIPAPSGEPRVWRANVFPVRHPDGSPLGVGVIREDVTERERAADALRESEARFRSMADGVPALIWLSDLDLRRTYFNKTWLEFTGRAVEQELGDGWLEGVHPDYRARYLGAYAAAFDARKPFEIEYRLRRRDGAYRWVLARGTPRFTPAGEFAGFVGLCLDVTDRRTAEENLRRSEARYRTLTEAIPQVVWNAGPDGEVSYFNRRWLDYTGLPVERAAGRGWLDAAHPDDRDRVFAAWRAAVEAPAEADRFAEELRLRRAGTDEYRWFQALAVPLRHPDGGVDQWIGAMADIDDQKRQAETLERMVRKRTAALVEEVEERRRVEEQVREVAAELARSNTELEQFAYIASHDLQEPLRKIQAFGDRLRTRFRDELPDGGKEYVDRMHASAGRMRRLIDDLLNYSRVTTQARPFARVDLGELVREVAADLDEQVEQSGGSVRVGELPRIDGDPSQLRQLFQNLIANALKFRRPDVPPVVEVRGEAVEEPLPGPDGPPVPACRITVRDNGIGFDEKYRERIFQVFQRLHGRDEYEGTGVGLAICRKIAQRHGGAITARSRPGGGATFVVTLPVRQQNEDPAADAHRDAEAGHDPDGR